MKDAAIDHELDAPPTADDVTRFRNEAKERDESVAVVFTLDDGTERTLTVSPRGTCVVLEGGTSNEALHPQTSADDVAAACTA